MLAALIPLVAASLALGSYLNYAGVRHNYLELVGDRMSTVAERIANDAEVAMSMGVPLTSQDVMNRSLEREAAADPMVLSIDVVGSGGNVLFSSDPDRRGSEDRGDSAIAWRHFAPIDTAFGTNEGNVVVRASQQALDANVSDVGRSILWLSVLAILGGVAIVSVAVMLSVRALWHRLTDRAPTASGAMVPQEIRASIAAVDDEHRAVAERLGLVPQKTGA
ncbi:hypothetical protein DLJ53_05350 [Acuticoccus sediminis]|uniref:HAMP domain-containing protein n=1 Tax=Acuticoccus sediminis TaxID=2184697 RepID=A0A8B2NUN6_9HYPH|nr:hypothetical protein [Acuticoccus sediminis]RAI03897.1 hypothetical protein DLJ53_05350 [Acuticoccus sediminis]